MILTDQERVITLRQGGLSDEAIAAALGVEVSDVVETVISPGTATALPLGPNAPSGPGGGGSAGPWRSFSHGGPGPQTWWNGWTDTPDFPALFRRVGSTIQMSGHALGGVAAAGNAIVQFPADALPDAEVFFPAADLRVHIIGPNAYLVMIDGTGSPFDLSVVTFNSTP